MCTFKWGLCTNVNFYRLILNFHWHVIIFFNRFVSLLSNRVTCIIDINKAIAIGYTTDKDYYWKVFWK